MNVEQMALIAGIAQDIENISMRLQELVRQTLLAAEEKADWRPLPCLSESPSSILELSESPTSVSSQGTPELVVSEICCDGATCVHRCSVCLTDLTLRDEEGFCVECVEDLETVPKDYPEDAADATRNSLYGKGAFYALVLRIRANNFREAAVDAQEDDATSVRNCLKEAKRLDSVASDLLFKGADSTFKPWWYTRWDYWMQPSYKAWTPEGKPMACVDCNIVNGFHVGFCRSAAPAAPAPYKNRFWPSPRPKLFAKACAPEQKFKKHQDALEFLARRAGTTVEDLLKMSPGTYIQKHMGNKAPECWIRLRR